MALLRFVQRNYGLPDPKDSLSSKVPAATIARATHEVQAELQSYANKARDEAWCMPSLQRQRLGGYTGKGGDKMWCMPSLQPQRLGSNAHHTAHAHGAVGCMKQWCGKHATTI